MLDVHPPHQSVHGWRDFFLHLITITIGLLIALSLEGCVEWQHHRHLVHEAESSLHNEIKSNADSLAGTIADIHKQQANLAHDVTVLKYVIREHKMPSNEHMDIAASIRGFDDVAWRTAQTTGAFSYMPYTNAQEFADIYKTQEIITATQNQVVRDAIISVAPFQNLQEKDPDPTPEQAATIKDHIEILQGQLRLLDSLVTSLDQEYKKFLTAHP